MKEWKTITAQRKLTMTGYWFTNPNIKNELGLQKEAELKVRIQNNPLTTHNIVLLFQFDYIRPIKEKVIINAP